MAAASEWVTPDTITPTSPPRMTLVMTATLPATLGIFWNGCQRALSITTVPSSATAWAISEARSGTSWL
jgi:hypothetical protein